MQAIRNDISSLEDLTVREAILTGQIPKGLCLEIKNHISKDTSIPLSYRLLLAIDLIIAKSMFNLICSNRMPNPLLKKIISCIPENRFPVGFVAYFDRRLPIDNTLKEVCERLINGISISLPGYEQIVPDFIKNICSKKEFRITDWIVLCCFYKQVIDRINFYGCCRINLDEEISVLRELQSLTELDKWVATIQDRFPGKEDLTHLDCTNQRLVSIPPEIGRLQALTDLNLSNNQISELPSEIERLQQLIALVLDGNQIR